MSVETIAPHEIGNGNFEFSEPEKTFDKDQLETSEATNDSAETSGDSFTGRALRRVADALDNHAESADARAERNRDRIENAKDKMRGFGRSAMSFLKSAGKIGATVGFTGLGGIVIGSSAAGKGIARGANAVIDKGVQASAYIDRKVEAGYDAYDKTVQTVKDTAYEAKWRASGAVEGAVDSVKAKASSLKFETAQKLKEANPLPELRDEFNLAKAGASDLKFEAGMWKNAMLERAGAALRRKAERAKAFQERGVELFNDTREAARKRTKRIGRRAMIALSAAHESGQVFVDRVKAPIDEPNTEK